MNRNKHIVIADENGDFYCRVVNDVLNIKKRRTGLRLWLSLLRIGYRNGSGAFCVLL